MEGNLLLFLAVSDFFQNSIIRLSSIQIGLDFNADSQSSQTNYQLAKSIYQPSIIFIFGAQNQD